MRRDLVSVRDPSQVLGWVVVDGDFVEYGGAASNALGGLIRSLGEREAAQAYIRDGWANGAGLYLTDATPGRTSPEPQPTPLDGPVDPEREYRLMRQSAARRLSEDPEGIIVIRPHSDDGQPDPNAGQP